MFASIITYNNRVYTRPNAVVMQLPSKNPVTLENKLNKKNKNKMDIAASP